MKDPVPNHTTNNAGLPAEPTLLSITPPETHCYGQVICFPFSYGWKTRRKRCVGEFCCFVCTSLPGVQMECTSEWKPPCASISKWGGSTRPLKAELSRGWHSVITEHQWKRGELIEWVGNLVARVTLSWLEGRDHRVWRRLCWIGKWCLMCTPYFCFWAGKGKSKKG